MDPAAWGRLVMTFGPIVYRWCRSSGVRQADAPDVVQDVFATVAKGIASFQRQKEQGSFRSWLATITRSRIRDFRRRALRNHEGIGGSDAYEQLHQVADQLDSSVSCENIASPLARRALELVRAEFEPATWQAFWQTTVDGHPAAIVAAQLQTSIANVYQARSRILRRLRQCLSDLP